MEVRGQHVGLAEVGSLVSRCIHPVGCWPMTFWGFSYLHLPCCHRVAGIRHALPCAQLPTDSGHQTQVFPLAQQALCHLSHLPALGSQFWRFLINWLGSFEHIMAVKGTHRENCSLHCAQKAKRGEGWSPTTPLRSHSQWPEVLSWLCFSKFQTSL